MTLTYRVERLSACNLGDAAGMAKTHIYRESGAILNREELQQTLIEIAAGDGVVLVAYDECDVPAGLAIGLWKADEADPYYEVRGLWVEPADRGCGVAKLLMQALIDWTGEQDAPVFICTQGEPRGAYRRLGFTPSHVVSRASLKELRERLGGGNEYPGTGPGGCGGSGSDECVSERAAAGGAV